jgi:DNA-directed RNA polymerase subunit RPC12/RpoP
MKVTCEYCRSSSESASGKCLNCGAPLASAPAADPHQCPYCHRRLLALGSPNCNYCGRRLPEESIKANTADLNRVKDLSPGDNAGADIHVVDLTYRSGRQEKPSGPLSILFDLTDLVP